MQLLQNNNFNKILVMFSNIPGCDVIINSIKLGDKGAVYVDNINSPSAGLVTTHYGFYCLGGNYDEKFLIKSLEYIKALTIEKATNDVYDTYIFLFFNSDEWKDNSITKLDRYDCKLIQRNYYSLNEKLFLDMADEYKKCPHGYEVKFITEGDPMFVMEYKGKCIGSCKKGSKGKYADIDVFIDDNHRRKGLALCLVSNFLLYCLKEGYKPRYGCWGMNKPSAALAEKLGFRLMSQVDAAWCVIK